MKIQLSEKQIMAVICTVFMGVCCCGAYADENSERATTTESLGSSPKDTILKVNKDNIYMQLKEHLSREISLIEAGSAKILAKKLLEPDEQIYYVMLPQNTDTDSDNDKNTLLVKVEH